MTETNARPGRPGRHGAMSGRQAEAARNDQRILESARAVFVADPGAPITAVAKHAGVGISALYTRYGSKEELLRTLCTGGLQTFIAETEAAIERVKQGEDRWQVFADFMRNLTDADTSSLTRAAAIKFADPERTTELRHRYLALILDGMRANGRGELPGPPPSWPEISERWNANNASNAN